MPRLFSASVGRRAGRGLRTAERATASVPLLNGKVVDLTGPQLTELTFRRVAQDKWILGGFLASRYALGYRVVDSPVANMHTTPLQMPVVGSAWHGEDHLNNQVAQLYGGYVLPGSRFDIEGGIGLVVSQWNTAVGWPYRAMQFKAGLKDSTKAVHPPDPINL